jgi:hypothetical protein
MRIYQGEVIFRAGDSKTQTFGTRDEAHKWLKEKTEQGSDTAELRENCRIFMFDVRTDKEGVVAALNGFVKYETVGENTDEIQRWKLSRRGGLVELDHEERPIKRAI